MTPEDPHSDAVDELMELLEALYPDPVDTFEDALAARLGFVRHPSCSLDAGNARKVTQGNGRKLTHPGRV